MMKILPLFALALMAPADTARGADADPTLEIVTFRLTEGADIDAFIDAAKGTEAWLDSIGSVVARSLTVDESGLWTDMVTWTSKAAALKAAEEAITRPEFGPFMAHVDPASVEMRHATILWQMD